MRSFSPIALDAAEDIPTSLADDGNSESEADDEDSEYSVSEDAESEVMLSRRSSDGSTGAGRRIYGEEPNNL